MAVIFNCRCCPRYCWADVLPTGVKLPEGWKRIAHIDGPDSICPTCVEDPAALECLFLDGYPDAAIVENDAPPSRGVVK